MPCTAKKAEAARKEFTGPDGPMVDLVLTTLEFSLMIKESGFNFALLEEEAPDMPFGLVNRAEELLHVEYKKDNED